MTEKPTISQDGKREESSRDVSRYNAGVEDYNQEMEGRNKKTQEAIMHFHDQLRHVHKALEERRVRDHELAVRADAHSHRIIQMERGFSSTNEILLDFEKRITLVEQIIDAQTEALQTATNLFLPQKGT